LLSSQPEPIIPLPEVISPVTHVRSTLIQSSLKQLEVSGYFADYERRLPSAERSAILETLGPTWMRVESAQAHYQACDELGLTAPELSRMGEAVGKRMNSTLIGTLARVAKVSGVTPWQFYGQLQRLWGRAFQGGAIGLSRVGPNESLIEARGLTLCRYAYFRHGFSGVITSVANLVANNAKTVVVEHGPEHVVMRGSWNAANSRKVAPER
jgi:hypothetical protein